MINNEEEEGKGRRAKRPRERLKFQIFPTIVALLNLEQWHMALTGQMLDESAIFAMDNGREASSCGQDWLHNRNLLVLYRYQRS